QIPVIATGARMPDFRLPVYNGSVMDTLSFNDLKDKVVLVEFWFKSCGPCIKAMPKYNALQDKYKDQGFELVTVNLEDPVEDLDFFYKKYPPHYRMLYQGLALFNSLGFEGCPSSVLVDRSGKVVKTFYGYDEEAVGESIASLL
ncbi:MAG: TlpA family protein disulfide reductase, partial [Chitinophagaceae bacterium]